MFEMCHSHSTFEKSGDVTEKICQLNQMGIKNAEFYAEKEIR
jgi:hypothetical protein